MNIKCQQILIYQQSNLKNKINKQDKIRIIGMKNVLMIARWGVGEMGKKADGFRKYKLVVTE